MIIPSLVYSSTDRCDMRCEYCPHEGPTSYGENFEISVAPLSPEDVIWAVNTIGETGFSTFRLTGGEPLLNPDRVAAILKGIVQAGHFNNVRLNTNGSHLAQAVGPLTGINLTVIKVSLDTINEELFKKVTKSKKFHSVLAGIETANAAGLPVEVNAVLTNETAAEMMDLVEWCQERGLSLKILDLASHDSQPEGYIEREKVRSTNVDMLLRARFGIPHQVQLSDKRGIYMKLYGTSPYVLFKDISEGTTYTNYCRGCTHFPCDEGIHHLSLSTDGHLRPCRIRNNVWWDINPMIRTKNDAALKRLARNLLGWFYSGEFSIQDEKAAI